MNELASRYTIDFITFFAAMIVITWLIMALSVLIDLSTGIEKAKALKQTIDSHNLRRTFTKMGDYWRVQAFGLMIDICGSIWYSVPIASMVIGLSILIIEARSVIENLKQKKSAAANLQGVIEAIIDAKNTKDANSLLKLIFQGKETPSTPEQQHETDPKP